MKSGEIYRHKAFYIDPQTGKPEDKYLVLLAAAKSGDLVSRLLTSQVYARPEDPACSHAAPYPSFYLGVLGAPLAKKSWVDLRFLADFDIDDFGRRVSKKRLELITQLRRQQLIDLLICASTAPDTTMAQYKAILDELSLVRSRP